MKAKWRLAQFIFGGFLAYTGWWDLALSWNTSQQPVEIPIEQLERGELPENRHMKLSGANAIYRECVFCYKTSKDEPKTWDYDTKPEYLLLPLVSKDRIAEMSVGARVLSKPVNGTYLVVFKTSPSYNMKELKKKRPVEAISVDGVMANMVESLSEFEKRSIKKKFPWIDESKIILIGEGRPLPIYFGVSMLALGVGMLVFFGIWVVKDYRGL